MLIYDTQNFLQQIRPVMVVREQGVMMAVGDLQSVQEVTTKIGKLVNFIDGAKGKNVKVQPLSKELDHDLIDIRDLMKN